MYQHFNLVDSNFSFLATNSPMIWKYLCRFLNEINDDETNWKFFFLRRVSRKKHGGFNSMIQLDFNFQSIPFRYFFFLYFWHIPESHVDFEDWLISVLRLIQKEESGFINLIHALHWLTFLVFSTFHLSCLKW